jgi:translation initiation factor IF-2
MDRPMTRDDYIGPGGSSGRPPVLENKPRPLDGITGNRPDRERPKGPVKREPVVKLAAIPQQAQPSAVAKSNEPAPQKPIITLPKDAIRGAREGTTAPLEQFTRQQERKRRDEEEASQAGASPPATSGESSESGDRRPRPAKERRKARDLELEDAGEDRRERQLAGMASTRQSRQQNRKRRTTKDEPEEEGAAPAAAAAATTPLRRRATRLQRRGGANTAAPRKGKVVVEMPCTVRSFSEATGVPAATILRALMAVGGSVPNINAMLDDEVAEMLADDSGLEVEFKYPQSLEDSLLESFESADDEPENLVPRPPVVTFLGHVDHGKTSLLDRIIGINVVSGEAGGITQHIRAYQVEKDGRKISFVDTPGHEAFTEMRARGANVTDIAVLVVAADDGVMPQTEEAISHARAAEVPIVVALNKIDLPGVDANRALQDLSAHGLLPTEWGGDVEVIRTSATTGTGLDDLLETLLLTADIHEYQANPSRPAIGTCLESQQEGGRGVVAKMIVQNGTLRVGDIVVCGGSHGRVKAMYDTLNPRKKIDEAGPSVPVNLLGLDVAPGAGERFYVLDDISQARTIAEQRSERTRERSLGGVSIKVSFEEFQRRLEEGRLVGAAEDVTVLNLIIRADVRGSIEAIQKELAKLDHPEVQVRVLQASVGGVTVADVTLADASDAVIVGFNVIPDEAARSLADERGVEIRRYDIIYKLTEDIKSMLEGKLKPEEHVKELGRALVQQVFSISRVGTVAGCRVLAGTIERGCRIRVNREGRGIGDYPLDSLKREKDDAKEVREGFECGIRLSGFNDIKEGDILEAYKIEEVARTL